MKNALLRMVMLASVLMIAAGTTLAASSLAVSDWWTDHPYLTEDLSVDANDAPNGRASLTLVAEEKTGFTISGYSITESDFAPGDWHTEPPVEYLFDTMPAQGMIALHAWVQYDQDGVKTFEGPFSDWIVYSTNVPVITNVASTLLTNSVRFTWDTEDGAGAGMEAIGWAEYRLKDTGDFLLGPASTLGYGTSHRVTVPGLIDEAVYEVRLHSNTVASDIQEVTIPAASPTTLDVTWTGGAAAIDRSWIRGFNWSAGSPPAIDTSAIVTFADEGVGENEVEQNRSVGTLNVLNHETAETTGKHTFTLHENRLIVKNEMRVGEEPTLIPTAVSRAEFVGGTLQFGTETETADLYIDSTHPGAGYNFPYDPSILSLNGTILDANFGTVRLGYAGTTGLVSAAIFDLTQATLSDNTLRAENLELGCRATNNMPRGYLQVSESTNLEHVVIANKLLMSDGHRVGPGRFGDPTNDYKLPSTIRTFTIGSPTTPGSIYIANSPYGGGDAYLIAAEGAGGTFTAYLTEMKIADMPISVTYPGGEVDLREMDSCLINSDTISITLQSGRGKLLLPPGEVVAGDILIGTAVRGGASLGLMELNDTLCQVTGLMQLGYDMDTYNSSCVVRVNLDKGESNGIDIIGNAELVIEKGGLLEINFNADGEYWGLRIPGDKRTFLNQALTDGDIVANVDGTATTNTAGVYYDDTYTYIALKATWGPDVDARDITAEFVPGEPVVITAQDVDKLYEFREPGDTIELSTPGDEDGDPSTVTVTVSEHTTFTLTLTVTSGGEQASDTSTLTLNPIAAETQDDVIWTGAARTLTGMDRKQWLWGLNWDGGNSPAADTNAKVTFASDGLGDNDMTESRSLGELHVIPAFGTHRFNLGANRLTVKNTLRVGGLTNLATAEFIGGTLQVGNTEVPGNLYVGSSAEGGNFSYLILRGTQLEGNFNDLKVASVLGDKHSVLDLTEAAIVGGVLRARNLQIAGPGDGNINEQGYLLVSEGTGLTDIIVAGTFSISHGPRCGIGRFGDPTNGDHKLPEDVSISIGTSLEDRGSFLVGNDGYGYADGYLAATGGGIFTAYVTDIMIGSHDHPHIRPGGHVDLAAMDSCLIHVNRLGIAEGLSGYSNMNRSTGLGSLRLPEGHLYVNDAYIGSSNDGTGDSNKSEGLLELNGTQCHIATSLAIGSDQAESIDKVVVNVNGSPAGLDLAEGVTPVIGPSGSIEINFLADNQSGETYWGLRWAGEHAAELEALHTAEKLVWDDTEMASPVGIFELEGYTYVGTLGVRVTEFAVTGDTGSELFTQSNQVGVSMTAIADVPDAFIDGWQITETDEVPETWLGALPTGYLIQGEPGEVTLHAWAKDNLGNVGSRPASILYQPSAPVISNVDITDNGDGTLTVTWNTDVPAYGKIDYRLDWEPDWTSTPFVGPTDTHSVVIDILGLEDERQLLIITSNAATYETEWPLPDQIYPTGDANQDCIVDLLDLVFVRNRMFAENLDINENRQADINRDNAIDLEDLIMVRNDLSAECTE